MSFADKAPPTPTDAEIDTPITVGGSPGSSTSLNKKKGKKGGKGKNTDREKDNFIWQEAEPIAEQKFIKGIGSLIKSPDYPHVEPRDYLISGRVAKRHTRPLTIAEVKQRNRLLALQKLDFEMR